MVFNRLIFLHVLALACTVAGASDRDMQFEELMLQMSDFSSNLTKEAKQFQPPKPPKSLGERGRDRSQSLQDELNEIEENLKQLMNVHKNIIPKQLDSLLKALEIKRDLQTQANDQLQSQINALQSFHGAGQQVTVEQNLLEVCHEY